MTGNQTPTQPTLTRIQYLLERPCVLFAALWLIGVGIGLCAVGIYLHVWHMFKVML
jgi:hypothetical protein